jgi:hypothetical protein
MDIHGKMNLEHCKFIHTRVASYKTVLQIADSIILLGIIFTLFKMVGAFAFLFRRYVLTKGSGPYLTEM